MARLRGKRWQADVRTADGARLRPTFDNQPDAEAWEAAARAAIVAGRPVPEASDTGTERRPGGADLSTLGRIYDHVCRTEWDAQKGGATQKRNGRAVVDYFGRNKRLDEITSADAASMKIHFAAAGNAPSTVNRKQAALSKMLRTAAHAGTIEKVPHLKWNQEEQTRFRYLDASEEVALLAYWKLHDDETMHDFTLFLLDTGARAWTEGQPLEWSAFGPGDTSVTFWQTKSGKPRTVPLTPRLREMIARRRRKMAGDLTGPFEELNKSTFRHRWDTMRGSLPDFSDVTPHTLRHTCCTRLVLGGADVKRVMAWMGHSSIQTTMRYMQVRASDLEDLLGLLDQPVARRA